MKKQDLDLLSPKGVRGEEALMLFGEWKSKVQPSLISSTDSCLSQSVYLSKPKKRKLDFSKFCIDTNLLSPRPSTPKRKIDIPTDLYSDISDTEMDNENVKSTKFDRIRQSESESDTDDDTVREEGNDVEQNDQNSINSGNCENLVNQREAVIFNGTEVEILENVNVEKEFPGVVFEPSLRVSLADVLPSKGLSAKVDSFNRAQGQKVVLNVGGTRFECSRESLVKDPKSLFAELFREESAVKPSLGNQYFFDRDPTHFRIILNYLRNGCKIDIRTLPKDVRYLDELFYEAEYYNLLKLIESIVAKIEQVNVVSTVLPGGSKIVFQLQ